MARSPTAERVRELIRNSGLTQGDFATKAGLDSPKMSKSLAGDRRFTSLDLARIAELGGVTVDWLLGGETDIRSLAARGDMWLLTSADAAVQEATRFAQIRADLAYLGYQQHVPELVDDVAKYRSPVGEGAELAAVAVEHVRKAGAESSQRDLASLVEDAFDVDVAVVGMPDGFDGLAWSDRHAQLIVVGASELPARQRFTIAHELEHLLVGDDQALHLDANLTDSEHKEQPSEKRANAFAASFLMPEDELRGLADRATLSDDVAVARLAFQLSVSPSTLAWRLYNLKLINWQRRNVLLRMSMTRAAQLAGEMGTLAEWIEMASRSRVPSGLLRCTFQAYADGNATLRPFANLIGVDSAALRRAIDEAAEEQQLAP